ncbi:uncharacterized protein DS421_15g515620 [Arachis hypogaea]|nr:uncharacterized protein DS421_15g515620 [Arachis hypogaea]
MAIFSGGAGICGDLPVREQILSSSLPPLPSLTSQPHRKLLHLRRDLLLACHPSSSSSDHQHHGSAYHCLCHRFVRCHQCLADFLSPSTPSLGRSAGNGYPADIGYSLLVTDTGRGRGGGHVPFPMGICCHSYFSSSSFSSFFAFLLLHVFSLYRHFFVAVVVSFCLFFLLSLVKAVEDEEEEF